MALALRPRFRDRVSDPLYAGTGGLQPGAVDPPPFPLQIFTAVTALCFLGAFVPGAIGSWSVTLRWWLLLFLVCGAIPYVYRILRHGLLWRLRNKLTLTYLLIGFTPVLLFSALVFLAAYTVAGQFAIHLASVRLQARMEDLSSTHNRLTQFVARRLAAGGTAESLVPRPTPGEPATAAVTLPTDGIQTAAYLGERSLPLPGVAGVQRTPLRYETWLDSIKTERLELLAVHGGVLYLVAVQREPAGESRTLTVISSQPVTNALLDQMAEGLGEVVLLPELAFGKPTKVSRGRGAESMDRLVGGDTPRASNFIDGKVRFFSAIDVYDWETGEVKPVPLNVVSRPSILIGELFGGGLTGGIRETVRFAFIAICVVFALLQVFAFYVALRLSRSITSSVEDLYDATLSIDSGDLSYRIQVSRDDQLADLGRSFNRMAWSLARLIDEQTEKERMQSELSIAQEVQENLFPPSNIRVPTLDLHGICRPARTVSGDYYDFLLFHDDREHRRDVTGVGLALGDISGKGISAALLMATLHSAVRAYRFASEEMLSDDARAATHQESLEGGELFESPARILSLLNRHLYRSTQPEKYATLFLAHYSDKSGRLTYSNAGQLPPLVLRQDGTVVRLDRGGTVVGLLDDATYEQGTLAMRPGDLIVAYSDGVTEPENDFGEFGEDRLMEVVRQFRDEPLNVISAEVMKALDAWMSGGEQPDDITLVLARHV